MKRGQHVTKPCSPQEARNRLRQAREYLDVAERYTAEDPQEKRAVGASNAVLAGIAASDAACGWVLGRRNAGAHEAAPKLLRSIRHSGQAAAALHRLLDVKSRVQYVGKASGSDLDAAVSEARKVVEFAERTME